MSMRRFGTYRLQKQFKRGCDDFYVNIWKILEDLKPYEVNLSKLCKEYKIKIPDELKNNALIDINTELRCLLENEGIFEEVKTDNTYNYYGRIDKDIAFTTYLNKKDDMYYVDLSVHYGGDSRVNYSDSVIYRFEYETEFYDFLLEKMRIDYVNYKGIQYKIITCALRDFVEVYGGSFYELEVLESCEIYKENIKDMLQGYINNRNKNIEVGKIIEIYDMQDEEKMKIVDFDKQYNNMFNYKIEKIGRYDFIVASIDNPTIKIRVKKNDLFEIKER